MSSEKIRYAATCLFSCWVMLFAGAQLNVIIGVHEFIGLRSATPYSQNYGMAQEQLNSSGFLKVGNMNKVLSKKIMGDFRHSDMACIVLVVLILSALYIFILSLGRLDSR